jgi:cytochrome c oxidase subunit I
MTLTATRPAQPSGATTSEVSEAAILVPDSPLTTSDHKRIGRYYIVAGVLFVLVGTVIGILLEVQLSASGANVAGSQYDRLFNLHTTVSSMLFLPLMFTGLAVYLVPLQIGARRLAFPRLQALAFWGTVFGGLLLLASYTFGKPTGWGIAYPTALPFAKAGASRATDLWAASLMLIAFCGVLSAVNLFTTVLKLRAPGMTMVRVPAFSWSVLVVSAGILLATPVFAAGLLVIYLDEHFGGGVFRTSQLNGNLVWQHLLWLYGRPDVYLVIVPALGGLTDVVATHSRRPLLQPIAAKGLIFAAMLLCFGILASGQSIEKAVLLPTPSVLSLLVAAPIGLVALLWLGTIRPPALRLHVSVLYLVGFLILLAAGLVNGVIAPSQHLHGGLAGAGSAWTVGQVHAVLFGAPTLAAFGAVYHWGPKIYGRALNALLGILQWLLLMGGFGAMAVGSWLAGYDGAPWHVTTYTGPKADDWFNYGKAATAGGVLVGLGLLVFLGNLALTWMLARRTPVEGRPADPYEAGTLEWATSSPPPEDNFLLIPEVRSDAPLADWRLAQAAGGEG